MTTEPAANSNLADSSNFAADGQQPHDSFAVKMVDMEEDSLGSSSNLSGLDAASVQKRNRTSVAKGLATKENKAVLYLRVTVMVSLFIVTAVVLAGVYIYSSQSEQNAFEESFTIHARQLTDSLRDAIDRKLVAVGSMSNAVTSHALFIGAEFPFVTLPDFAVKASDTRVLADALVVGWCPLVTDDNRLAWEEYAFMNRYQMNENLAQEQVMLQEQDEYFDQHDPNRLLQEEEVNPNVLQDGTGYNLRIYNPVSGLPEPNGTGPWLPGWQRSPINFRVQALINFNWANAKTFEGADVGNQLLKDPKVIFQKMAPSQPKFFKAVTANLRASHYRDRVDAYLEDPLSFLAYPVFDSFNTTTRKVGGAIIANLYWRIYFESVLPSNAKGIICVISNSYNQTFSYLVNGKSASLMGAGDFHDTAYDDLAVSLDVTSFLKQTASSETRAFLTVPVHDTLGRYTLKVYPTDETKEEYTTSKPILYTVIVGAIFVFTAAVFILFDVCVEKRQKVVMKRAVGAGAIVNSLFPQEVQERMYEDEPTEEKKKKERKSWTAKAGRDHGIEGVTMGEQEGRELSKGGQIADQYLNCTVIFSDLAGFTAWSSSRSPCEVFELLETIYNAMDAIALRRKVFKVETIGDCWLGVCGLPNPNSKHAIVTARFADDCQRKVQEIATMLVDRLGADTNTLQLRTGLHSGSVTAGVLRGQKSRFQLFGDTVNTASRMETSGQPGRIHASQETADELIASGKGSWLKARDDKIVAKGKGEMQTYWIDVGMDAKTYATSTFSPSDDGLEDLALHANQQPEESPQAGLHGVPTQVWM